jgi:hypothetical protein
MIFELRGQFSNTCNVRWHQVLDPVPLWKPSRKRIAGTSQHAARQWLVGYGCSRSRFISAFDGIVYEMRRILPLPSP